MEILDSRICKISTGSETTTWLGRIFRKIGQVQEIHLKNLAEFLYEVMVMDQGMVKLKWMVLQIIKAALKIFQLMADHKLGQELLVVEDRLLKVFLVMWLYKRISEQIVDKIKPFKTVTIARIARGLALVGIKLLFKVYMIVLRKKILL